MARQLDLTTLAISGLSGTTPYRLSVEACHLIATQLDAVTTIETRAGLVETAPTGHLVSYFVVPIGARERCGRIVVGSTLPRAFDRREVAFVERVADVIDRVATAYGDAESLRHQASHDTLTGLPNRAALEAKLRSITIDEVPVGVLVCDLDGLKMVNDHLGHRRGDELLIAVAQRIRDAARTGDLVARTGGDEFVVVCSSVSAEEAQAIAHRIRVAVAEPLVLGNHEVTTTLSVGIALSDAPCDTAALVDQADAAMYRSKQQQRGSLRHRVGGQPAAGEAVRSDQEAMRSDQLVVDLRHGFATPDVCAPHDLSQAEA